MLVFIKINHVISLITNSSSELFVLEAKSFSKQLIVELINEAFGGATIVNENSLEDKFFKDVDGWDENSRIENALDAFPERDREELREKYFKNPNYYGLSFDRDWIYVMEQQGFDVRESLTKLGFEVV